MTIDMQSLKNQRDLWIKGEASAKELVEETFKRIEKTEDQVKAYLCLQKETAMEQAIKIDEKRARGEKTGALAGVPLAVKDNICTEGIPTTCASKMLENFIPPYNATVVQKIYEADGIMIGKTNLDEFAMGSSTESSVFQTTRNPWDLDRVPGGSSGGSAAAVAAETVPLALGSDTGGSIRQPAAFCGVVGIKPSYGLVSRYGLIAFASSLDQIGPMTKNVEDCAIALDVIAGFDQKDSTSRKIDLAGSYTEGLHQSLKGVKVALPVEYQQEGLDKEINKVLENTVRELTSLGAVVEKVSLPHSSVGLSAYYMISSAEASSNLARFDGIRYGHRTDRMENIEDLMVYSRSEGFGQEVKRRIMLGTYALSSGYYDAYYQKAQKIRCKIREQYSRIFEKYDAVLGPVSPYLPFRQGEKMDDPLAMYLGDVYTVDVNMSGLPAISLPGGFTEAGLPVGMQLIGNHFEEKRLFQIAYQLEKSLQLDLKSNMVKGGLK
ncbi:Asp-tRNA(Asn)/Glu-tRNA(Gln) amidotransferase subunit GatA [Tindallia californiensis]|uniref:Glutamyl-tRNA(Gln) amidotransferase subunit A n=1 Tax=Tindallia californiensis TaxID=159292 RepID=A0A1H3L374_9FIRM|nr:Asp-tRNA(Asn)/Glu-tRNA(Gln) amidotransferase subunit GatA [Tindallia californiensis]SDY58669.1 aspartyl/glutamyl-tRNA(Asn/Gln) amidotransferase subunit A [Tindallia californiensis]